MIATFFANVVILLPVVLFLALTVLSERGESLELDEENLLGGLLTAVMSTLVFFGLNRSGVLGRLLSTTDLTN